MQAIIQLYTRYKQYFEEKEEKKRKKKKKKRKKKRKKSTMFGYISFMPISPSDVKIFGCVNYI